MDAMTIPDVWSGQDRALTVKDMENMPDDEFRYELDDGVRSARYSGCAVSHCEARRMESSLFLLMNL